jgi:uracil-DNA glycosylase
MVPQTNSETQENQVTAVFTGWILNTGRKSSMTETVKAVSQYGPRLFPLPHPSWRSAIWMQKNPWFEEEVIPELRKAVRKLS